MAGERERPTRLTTTDIINDIDPATEAKQDTGNISLASIDTKLTSGGQKTQIVDAGGEAATVTGGKLDVNASFTPSGTQDVAVVSQIPGTGATNLGKAVDSAAGATDTGVASLGVVHYEDLDAHSNVDEGDYDTLSLTEYREVRTRDQRVIVVDRCDATTGWAVFNDDTANLATSTNHVYGTNALTFDKVNGTANTVYGMIKKTLTSFSIHDIIEEGGFVGVSAYLPSLTNVVNVVLRLGTDASNYQEWIWPVADLTAGRWLPLRENVMQPSSVVGNGWNTEAITFVAVGVQFNAEANTLAGIIVDRLVLIGGRVSDGTLNAGTNLIGNVGHGKTIKSVTGTVSADTDIVAAVPSKRIKVIAISLISASTTTNMITLQSNASTALFTVPLQAISGTIAGISHSVDAPSFLFATAAGEKLTLDVSAAQNVTYNITYFDDDAT